MTFQAFTGMTYHELQIGTLVVQVRRVRPARMYVGAKRIKIWRDPFGSWS